QCVFPRCLIRYKMCYTLSITIKPILIQWQNPLPVQAKNQDGVLHALVYDGPKTLPAVLTLVQHRQAVELVQPPCRDRFPGFWAQRLPTGGTIVGVVGGVPV